MIPICISWVCQVDSVDTIDQLAFIHVFSSIYCLKNSCYYMPIIHWFFSTCSIWNTKVQATCSKYIFFTWMFLSDKEDKEPIIQSINVLDDKDDDEPEEKDEEKDETNTELYSKGPIFRDNSTHQARHNPYGVGHHGQNSANQDTYQVPNVQLPIPDVVQNNSGLPRFLDNDKERDMILSRYFSFLYAIRTLYYSHNVILITGLRNPWT